MVIKNYYYNYKIKIENKKPIISVIERNYLIETIKNEKKTTDVSYNLFELCSVSKKRYIKAMNKFKDELLNNINNYRNSYDIEINYYCKIEDSLDNVDNYYELAVYAYNSSNKFGFTKKTKLNKLNYKELENYIFDVDSILNKKIDYKAGLIDSKNIIIKNYALSQILSLSKDNKYNFNNVNKVKYLISKLKTGYVINNVYFLNNNKENKDKIRLLCTGYYVDNEKIKYLFSNKIIKINIIDIINKVKYYSKSSFLSNDLACYDILTENTNLSIISTN